MEQSYRLGGKAGLLAGISASIILGFTPILQGYVPPISEIITLESLASASLFGIVYGLIFSYGHKKIPVDNLIGRGIAIVLPLTLAVSILSWLPALTTSSTPAAMHQTTTAISLLLPGQILKGIVLGGLLGYIWKLLGGSNE